MHARLAAALALTGLLSACPDAPIGVQPVDLKIVSVLPEAIFPEGGEIVTVSTENGCNVDALTVTIDRNKVDGVQLLAADTYTFSAPRHEPLEAKAEVDLVFTCSAHPTPNLARYKVATATVKVTYDPAAEPQPTVQSYGPKGQGISILGQASVVFSRPMLGTSITAGGNVRIDGVEGTTRYDAATRTASFVPNRPLAYLKEYTVIVHGGASGVKSAATGKPLLTTGATDFTWTFTTRCEGCGNPWTGDLAGAAGVSTSTNYKLFSVTGQPGPIGTTGDGVHTIEAGAIHGTQPQ